MTNTTVINAQSIGGTAAAPTQQTKLTLQASTAALSLNVLLATGSGLGAESSEIEVCWATSPFDITAGAAPISFQNAFQRLLVKPPKSGREQIVGTDIFTANGGYLYLWLNVPLLQAARTITVIVNEL